MHLYDIQREDRLSEYVGYLVIDWGKGYIIWAQSAAVCEIRWSRLMINAVRNALNSLLGSIGSLNNAAGAGRIYELFIMTGVAAELQNRGFDVWLQRSDGSRILLTDVDQTFVQRGGGPSGLPPASAGPGNASVIGVRKPSGSEWELWNGIQFRGRSGAAHEIDIAFVPRGVANQLRTTGGMPFGRPRVSIECKEVAQTGSVDEMRAFVARLYDLTLLQLQLAYIQTQYPGPAMGIYPASPIGAFYSARNTYWDENRHSFNALARRSGFASGATAMTAYYGIEPHASITLGSSQVTALIQAVCQWIESQCP